MGDDFDRLVGPLPRTTKGNTILCVIQDRFSKWVELKPLRKATSVLVISTLKEIFYRFGCPKIMVSDNGRQFISNDFKNFLEDFGIIHRLTPPYSPQCNPVERVNKVVKTMIRQYIDKKKPDWDCHLLELQFAYNTAKHTATGYTPAYLTTGREFIPPGFQDAHIDSHTPSSSFFRIKELHNALDLVRINLAKNFKAQQKSYNLRKRE